MNLFFWRRKQGEEPSVSLRDLWSRRSIFLVLFLMFPAAALTTWAATVWLPSLVGFSPSTIAVGFGFLWVLIAVTGLVFAWPPLLEEEDSSPGSSRVELARLISRACIGAIWGVIFLLLLAWFGLGRPPFVSPEKLTAQMLESLTTRAFAIIAGLGGVVFLVIGYRRQRTTEGNAERDTTRLFTERFTAASEQLGHAEPPVKLAAVHALGHLADDAPTDGLRQMVIDVLCAYLRMPYQPAPGPLPSDATEEQHNAHQERQLAYESFREVRHTIIDVMMDRLRQDPRWQVRDYNFNRVIFDGGDFTKAKFHHGEVSFRGARFVAGQVLFESARLFTVDFTGAEFSGGQVSFHGALLSSCTFEKVRFSGARVMFDRAEILGWTVFESAQFESGNITFFGANIASGVDFRNARIGGSVIAIHSALVSSGMEFDNAWFIGPGGISFCHTTFKGPVSFEGALLNGGKILFDEIIWEGRWLSFNQAGLDQTTLSFNKARLESGRVDFSGMKFVHPQNSHRLFPAGLRIAASSGNAQVQLPAEWEQSARSPRPIGFFLRLLRRDRQS